MRYKCPCCGFYTFKEKPNGNYDICPVCYWEDDPCAYDEPDEDMGCNQVSLNQARKNYLEFGACREDIKNLVRPPAKKEIKGNTRYQHLINKITRRKQ